jgi:hypothetical protein
MVATIHKGVPHITCAEACALPASVLLCRLPGVLLSGQPVALRFQLPPGYPSAEPPLLSVECSANR